MHAWIPIALLPIGPKLVNKIPGYSVYTQEIQGLQTVHDVIRHLLQPLSDARCLEGYEMACADGNVRLCQPTSLVSMQRLDTLLAYIKIILQNIPSLMQ